MQKTKNKIKSFNLSRLLRRLFELKRIKTVMGGLVSLTTLVSSMAILPPNAGGALVSQSAIAIDYPIETITNKIMVVPEMNYVSQEFHYGHVGIDLASPLGAAIYPIKDGVVKRVEHLKYGYGRVIYIQHDNETESLYAHMGKIYVNEGDVVTTSNKIGEIGLTGRTTGPHLHLEVIKNGIRVNPRRLIEVTDSRRK